MGVWNYIQSLGFQYLKFVAAPVESSLLPSMANMYINQGQQQKVNTLKFNIHQTRLYIK